MGVPPPSTSPATTTTIARRRNSARRPLKTPFKCLPLALFISFVVVLPSINPTCNAEQILDWKDTTFSTWNQNVTYGSSTIYNPRGMAPLYQLTNQIIYVFIGDDAIPEGYIIVKDRNVIVGPKVEEHQWSDLLKHYWGLLLVISITALLVVLMPIIGLCFCCCRCAGACGGRSQPFDKKHDTCRRIFLGLLLICAATAILFGVVIAFVTNSYMQEGVEEVTTTARHGVEDTRLFLDSTSAHIKFLLVENYRELSMEISKLLKTTGDTVIEELEKQSQAISLIHLTDFVQALPNIKLSLTRMKEITNNLRVSASQLSDGLRGVKRELLQQLTSCPELKCQEILVDYEIGKLDTSGIDYDQLPDISEIVQSVDSLLSDEIIEAITKGKKAFDDLTKNLKSTINRNIPEIMNAIDTAGKSIKDTSDEFSKTLHAISDELSNNTYRYINVADKYIEKYSMYRYYVGIAVSSLLLLVLLCVTLALFCGICGKRPDGYGDDCCNKGSGARFLMLGVTVIFLTISVLAVIVLVQFLGGVIVQRGVCVPLRDPMHDQIFQNYYDDFIDLNTVFYKEKYNLKNKFPKSRITTSSELPPFRISDVIASCQQNKSIYEVLRLHNGFDINQLREYVEDFKIDKKLADLVNSIQIDESVKIMDKDTEKKIKDLAESDLNKFHAYKFHDELTKEITRHSLKDIANKLRETANNITQGKMNDVAVSLKNQALHLVSYEDNLVTPMKKDIEELLKLATNLENTLRPNPNDDFEKTINKLLKEIYEAQDFINYNGTQVVRQIATELTDHFLNITMSYMNLVIDSVTTKVGKCQPIANVYSAFLIAGCNKVIDPFNGFWAGVGWCILVFLPTLIISVKLSSLYQKSDPYPGPLVESEYLYDAYSERDNIPLANGPKNKRRKAKDRRRGSRDRRGDYYEDSGSSHGASAGRDTRYNDMAPKHWDGGPPRYQNPPMAPPASEYERPPPYYYPGAQSEQD